MVNKSWTTTKREDEIAKEIQILRDEAELIRSRRTIKCTECNKRTKISKVTVLHPHWYVQPSGCTGGDYWNSSNEYKWWCPKCGKWERVLGPSSYRKVEEVPQFNFIKAHFYHFGEHLDDYGEDSLDDMRENNKKRRLRY